MNYSEEQIIHVLPEFIANQIAAGEVVQRPESVVKELVENAIDAGATSIAVNLRQAGKSLIHVVDNGKGMSKSDVALATKRHATSKIKTSDDLHKIQTLGFRGEALASIASVAHVEIRTKRASDELGWKLTSEPLKEEIIEPTHCDNGTQVFVRNLFYNIPARRKFLRSDITEFRHVSDCMMRFALSYPSVAFTFVDGETIVFSVKPDTLENRIGQLFGDTIQRNLIPVSYSNQIISIEGFVGSPGIARTTRASQYFFLNTRAISSKSLSHAVYQGYEHLIDKSQHPLFVLNITLDAEKVDVNIHPQKTEVKFDDERAVYNVVQQGVLLGLRGGNLIPEIRFRETEAAQPFEKVEFGSANQRSDLLLVNTSTGEIISERRESTSQGFTPPSARSGQHSYQPLPLDKSRFDKTSQWSPNQMTAFESLFGNNEVTKEDNTNGSSLGDGIIWQMHNKYIFVQTPDGVMIIDQHIAHERILYEKALKALNDNSPYSQKLLFPVTQPLTPTEMILFRELQTELNSLGYIAKELNEHAVEISGVPLDIKAGEEASSLQEILDQYAEYQTVRPASSRDNVAASYGCRAAIKAGDYMSLPEMKKMIDDLFECQTPEVCPHGRPVMIEFQLKEFDRRFGRTS